MKCIAFPTAPSVVFSGYDAMIDLMVVDCFGGGAGLWCGGTAAVAITARPAMARRVLVMCIARVV